MKRLFFIALACVILASCSGYKSRKEAKDGYSVASKHLNELTSRVESLNPKSSVSDIRNTMLAVRDLSYDYNPIGA